MTTAETHTLAGAYALDAVTDLERTVFTRHLAECLTCVREVAEFRETAAKLGMAMATVNPGTRLRSRVLTEVVVTRQLRPSLSAEPSHRRSWRTRVVFAVAAVAAAVAVLLGGISIGALRSNPEPTTQVALPVGAVDAKVVRASGSNGGPAAVSFSRQRGEAVITAQALPPLDGGHAYQVWLIGPRGAQSAGLLPAVSGTLSTPLPADIDRIGITTEPATGSPQPTTPAMVRFPLS